MKKEVILSYFPKITQNKAETLHEEFDDWNEIKSAIRKDFRSFGWKSENLNKFMEWKQGVDIERIQKIHKKEGIHCVTIEDENYPKLLKQIHDPPMCLFVRGKLNADDFNIAVVGTRKYSQYGKQVTHKITKKLARAGITVVSGMAYGIDSFAHRTTLQASGRTVAVLGSGNNKKHIYPPEHRDLATNIENNGGAVITEYCPGTKPSRYTFPKRNRIVAGMSKGVLVVEAGESSGALITADCALDENREVFSIPHNITSKNGVGPNKLIKEGAIPVTQAEDILNEFHLTFEPEEKEIKGDNKYEDKVLNHLSEEPIHIDKLIKKTKISSKKMNSTLSMLEMKGVVKNLGNMQYILDK